VLRPYKILLADRTAFLPGFETRDGWECVRLRDAVRQDAVAGRTKARPYKGIGVGRGV
jgi:hypothetical protein